MAGWTFYTRCGQLHCVQNTCNKSVTRSWNSKKLILNVFTKEPPKPTVKKSNKKKWFSAKTINKHLSGRIERFIFCFQTLRGFTGWEGRTYNRRAPSSGWPRARHSPTPTGFPGTLTTPTPARTAWSPTGTGTESGRTPSASGWNTTSVKRSKSVWFGIQTYGNVIVEVDLT